MTLTWASFTTTPIYGSPALRLPSSGSIGEIEIPLHLSKLSPQVEGSQAGEITYGMVLDPTSNFGMGGTAVSLGANTLSKITMEGWIDNPLVITGNTALPGIVIGGYNLYYVEVIAAYFEGRTVPGQWGMVFPRWFRDPYGRVYAAPRIYDFTASRIEAVPQRTNFSMTLQVS